MLNNYKKAFLYGFFNFYYSDINHENKSLKFLKDNNIAKNNLRPYEETSQEGLLIFNENENKYKYFYYGIIEEIKWNTIPEEIKNNILNKFDDFQEGKELSWITLKQIILELNNTFNTSYICEISMSNNGQLKLNFIKKPGKKYFITSIVINGNNLLSKTKILNYISDQVEELNFINKIMYLIFGQSNAELNPVQSRFIENQIEKLSERYLILGTKTKILYEINPYNYNVTLYINIEEGKKHFVDQIQLNGFEFNKKILENFINLKGLEDNSFDYLSTILMEEYGLKRIKFTYSLENEKINIYGEKTLKDVTLIVENLLFNVKNVNLNYLTKNCPVTIGETFDEWEMRDFIYKTNFIFETKINYKLKPCKDNKILVEVTENIENNSKDIISSCDKGMCLQYPFKFHSQLFSLNIIPRLILNNNILLDNLLENLNENRDNSILYFGFNGNIKHKFNHKNILYVIDCNTTINILNIFNDLSKVFREFQISTLRYTHVSENFSLLFTPLNFHKFFTKKQISTDSIRNELEKYLQEYIYKYTELYIKYKLDGDNHNFYIKSYGKYFIHDDDNTYKFAIHINDTIILSKSVKILFTIKGLYNSQNIKNMKSIYKHLSAINNKRDEMLGLLWNYYDTFEELFPEYINVDNSIFNRQDFETYLISKGIILSNFLFDIRLMFLWNLFKFKILNFGSLLVDFHIFINFNYDITNKIFRLSGGFGLLGQINNIRLIFSTGLRKKWLYNNNEFISKIRHQNENNMKYAFNFEDLSF